MILISWNPNTLPSALTQLKTVHTTQLAAISLKNEQILCFYDQVSNQLRLSSSKSPRCVSKGLLAKILQLKYITGRKI